MIMAHFEKTIDELITEMVESNKAEVDVGTGIGIKHQILGGISAPSNLMGLPSQKADTILRDHIVQEDLDFEVIKESFFEYEFDNGFVFKGKVVLMNVDKTDIIDKSSMPVYLVNNTVEAKIRLPTKVKNRLLKEKTKKTK